MIIKLQQLNIVPLAPFETSRSFKTVISLSTGWRINDFVVVPALTHTVGEQEKLK